MQGFILGCWHAYSNKYRNSAMFCHKGCIPIYRHNQIFHFGCSYLLSTCFFLLVSSTGCSCLVQCRSYEDGQTKTPGGKSRIMPMFYFFIHHTLANLNVLISFLMPVLSSYVTILFPPPWWMFHTNQAGWTVLCTVWFVWQGGSLGAKSMTAHSPNKHLAHCRKEVCFK